MIITKQKMLSDIIKAITGYKNIFITGCGSCATLCKSGGEEEVAQMEKYLKTKGFNITGSTIIDEACHVLLTKRTYREHLSKIKKSDAILVMACGAGVQASSNSVEIPVIPALDTLFLGNTIRFGVFEQYCSMCGDCLLEITGGVCPATRCPKGLLNGPCGGVDDDGMCEVDRTLKCAWVEIYESLKKRGHLDRMKKIIPPKDYSKNRHPGSLTLKKRKGSAK
ncbi:MAG: methylenetetrahydrofolate reductase C-terminal domain-containing protein [Deltaproteobacteria bacterium]|nr:methylenetetrahydrofolate reductase C-terminal domain-containing protein [Deltaproteobacteria bacterium]